MKAKVKKAVFQPSLDPSNSRILEPFLGIQINNIDKYREEHTMSIDLKQNIKEMGQKLAELKDYL